MHFRMQGKKVMKMFKQFLKTLTGLMMIVVVAGLLACGQKPETTPAAQAAPEPEPEKETIVWRLAQTWGTGFPIFGDAVIKMADRVKAMSDGELEIRIPLFKSCSARYDRKKIRSYYKRRICRCQAAL